MTCEQILELARRMFARQAATYDAEPALVELAWADDAIRDFWTGEADAVVADLEELRAA